MSKRPSLLDALGSPAATTAAPAADPVPKAKPARKPANLVKMSTYVGPATFEQLRALAFDERCKVNSLVVEAIDHLFRARGLRSIADLDEA